MRSRLPVIAGLLSGVLVAALIVLAVVALAPDPAPAAPARTPGPSLASPTPTASVVATPSASGASPAPTAASANFRWLGATFPVGLDLDGSAQAAWGAVVLPVHFWVDREGIVREGALGGIGPDLMAHGLSTIPPGVAVTP